LGYLNRAHYGIVYKCPPRLRVLAIGRLERDWHEAGFHLSFYKSFQPAKAATFCLGNFSADTLAPSLPGLPQIEIYGTAQRPSHERKRVAMDVANSLYFFERLLGEYPLPVLRVVESPTIGSQGFPGFVTLSWIGFAGHVDGPTEALRSHEVAHQWFGNLLGWATYHDQWLSEAFAEYLGALYVEWVLRDENRFEEMLKAWNNDILNQGNVGVSIGMQRFGFSKQALRRSEGMKAGPIWMGIRLGQKEPLDYYMQLYEKGAYVLHMLRWLLRDLDTGSDDRFWAMLADFLKQYQTGEPTSADFQKIAEHQYGSSLDWFFQQWIFQPHVPTYSWSYSMVPAALDRSPSPLAMPPVARFGAEERHDGYAVRVQVRQENVPAPFEMPIPVTVEYVDGMRYTKRVLVTQEGGVLEFPAYPAKVARLIFNTGNAVLCRVVSN
jgi:aminopeptidase N